MPNNAGTEEVPEVYASLIDDTILVELSLDHAEALANVLAHYDALLAERHIPPADGYVHEVFHHTFIRILTAVNKPVMLQVLPGGGEGA